MKLSPSRPRQYERSANVKVNKDLAIPIVLGLFFGAMQGITWHGAAAQTPIAAGLVFACVSHVAALERSAAYRRGFNRVVDSRLGWLGVSVTIAVMLWLAGDVLADVKSALAVGLVMGASILAESGRRAQLEGSGEAQRPETAQDVWDAFG